MIDTAALKKKTLILAMSGKLSEQKEKDGLAIPKGIVVSDASKDSKAFEIPSNWKWVRVKDVVAKDIGGGTPSKAVPKYWENGDISWATVKDFSKAENGYIKETIDHITMEGLENSASNLVDEAAIIVCMRMALGKIVRLAKPMAINQDLRALWLKPFVLEDYFVYFYKTLRVEGRGTTVAGIKKDELMNYAFPVPPFEEQKRIVNKVDEIYRLINKIDELQSFYTSDLEVLQSKLIDAGIQGKLTEQLSEDGNVEDLYKKIAEEKRTILVERKGKEDKNIKEVDDDVPYKLPAHWKWVRFGEIGLFKKGPFGSALTKSMFVPKSESTIKVYEQQHAIQKNAKLGTYYISREYFDEKMSGFEVKSGDILVSCAGTIGETYILPECIEQGIINQALMRVVLADSVDKRFFQFYFDASLKMTAQKESKGSAIKNIPPFAVMKNWYFPLTSIEEQRRIVNKVKELLSLM